MPVRLQPRGGFKSNLHTSGVRGNVPLVQSISITAKRVYPFTDAVREVFRWLHASSGISSGRVNHV
jgi:hypothetical protein